MKNYLIFRIFSVKILNKFNTSSEDGETHVFNLTTMEDIVDNN